MKKNKYKPLVPFKSYKEEAEFWDKHNVLEDWSAENVKTVADKEKKEVVMHVKVEPSLKLAIERLARRGDRTVSSAVRKVLKEWVHTSAASR